MMGFSIRLQKSARHLHGSLFRTPKLVPSTLGHSTLGHSTRPSTPDIGPPTTNMRSTPNRRSILFPSTSVVPDLRSLFPSTPVMFPSTSDVPDLRDLRSLSPIMFSDVPDLRNLFPSTPVMFPSSSDVPDLRSLSPILFSDVPDLGSLFPSTPVTFPSTSDVPDLRSLLSDETLYLRSMSDESLRRILLFPFTPFTPYWSDESLDLGLQSQEEVNDLAPFFILVLQIGSSWLRRRIDQDIPIAVLRPFYTNISIMHNMRHVLEKNTPFLPYSVDINPESITSFELEMEDLGLLPDLHWCWPDLNYNSEKANFKNLLYTYEKHNRLLCMDRRDYFKRALHMYRNMFKFMSLPADLSALLDKSLPSALIGEYHPLGTLYTARQIRLAFPFSGHALLYQLKTGYCRGEWLLDSIGIQHYFNCYPVLGKLHFLPSEYSEDIKILWPKSKYYF